MDKLQKELESFKLFKKQYIFAQKEIAEINGSFYCEDLPLFDEDGALIPICEKWVNVGYTLKEALSKALSNLFPYTFIFKGQKLNSIEAFFQGIKFKDAKTQKYIFNYSGLEALHIKIATSYDWQASGNIFWQGVEIKRDSSEYEDLIDELYVSAIQNPLFRQVLKNTDRYILHSIGKEQKNETVFTRYEFEYQLNCLKDFVKSL